MKFRKKPVEIEAVQFDGEYTSVAELIANNSGMRWFSESAHGRPPCVEIQTLEGVMTATPGDWIIRGVKGEFYPCKPDIFALTYEPAVSSSSVADPWQSIATAPKDGTNVLLGWPKMVLGGYWADWRGSKSWVTSRGGAGL